MKLPTIVNSATPLIEDKQETRYEAANPIVGVLLTTIGVSLVRQVNSRLA